jgi:membrane protease YdiL (CAAX protease family)
MNEFINKIADKDALLYVVILIGGFVIFCVWLTVTSFGRSAFGGLRSEPRRNNMHPSVPFLVVVAYFVLTPCVFLMVCKLWGVVEDSWQFTFCQNVITSVSAIITGFIVILLVRRSFARSLKGFGLELRLWSAFGGRRLLRDLGAAVVTIWAVWPIVMAVLLVTIEIGKLIYGSDFNIEQHQELKTITTYSAAGGLPLIISVFVAAVLIAPIIEEMLFRGLFQSTLRSLGYGPWLSIAIGSFFFILFHAAPSHWPALFVLSMGLGYSYERSGSLLRPIFIHAIFNAASVVATLLTAKSVT